MYDMRVTTMSGGGEVHPTPFLGPQSHPAPVRITPSNFTVAEVDARGYLKAGTPLLRTGALVTAVVTAGEAIYGCLIEATKIAESNSVADLAAADANQTVIVATICTLNRAILEDALGRALTAGELAAANAPGGGAVVFIY